MILLSESANLKTEFLICYLVAFILELSNKHIFIFIIQGNMGIFTQKIKHKSFISIFFLHVKYWGP